VSLGEDFDGLPGGFGVCERPGAAVPARERLSGRAGGLAPGAPAAVRPDLKTYRNSSQGEPAVTVLRRLMRDTRPPGDLR
jgi:hypothetical protein